MDAPVTAGLIALAIGLTETIKILVQKFVGRTSTKPISSNGHDQSKMMMGLIDNKVEKLLEMHNVRDSDGVPVWYVPRSMTETQAQISERLRDVTLIQQKILDKLDVVGDKVADIENNVRGCKFGRNNGVQ